MAYMGQGHQPQEAHAPGETLKEESQQGKAPPRCLGGGGLLPWPPPPWRLDLLGAGAPPLGIPIYSGVGGPPKHTLCLWCSPSLSPKFLLLSHGAWRSPAGLPRSSTTTTPLCCCWMESSSTSPSLLYIVRPRAAHNTWFDLSLPVQPSLSFSSYLAVLGEALQDCHAPPSPPRRCAATGRSLPQSLPLSFLDQGMGDITGLHVC